MSLGFHVANSVLLFAVLRRMTAAFWRSAVVAFLFALHPLHVESVAWVAERKDVLSGFFLMLTLWAYARYAEGRRQKAECEGEGGGQWSVIMVSGLRPLLHPPCSIFYLLSLFLFALGLMSKPMLVTVPFVLLLLDYWPLKRLELKHSTTQHSRLSSPCVWEKLPFFALTVASSVITYTWALNSDNTHFGERGSVGPRVWPMCRCPTCDIWAR